MRSTARDTTTSLRIWLVFLLATVPAAGAVVAGGGPCFSVSLDRPVVLPGGATHDATSLRVCITHALSPVMAMHEIFVDRARAGMLFSRVGNGEAPGDGNPVVMFRRDDVGRLHLYGFAAPQNGRMKNYLLRPAGFGTRVQVHTTPHFARNEDAGTVLIAARDSNGRHR